MAKTKNKVIFHFYTEKWGEVEGMFDESGKMLDTWFLNDAHWRGEYMNGFIAKLGFDVKPLPKKFEQKALEQIAENFGLDPEDEDC